MFPACGLWASALQPDALLVTAASLVGQALSSGYTGFVTLQGILQASGLENWKSNLVVNHHPAYLGMMVASIHDQKTHNSHLEHRKLQFHLNITCGVYT